MRNKIYQHAGIFDEYAADEYIQLNKNAMITWNPPTTEEKKQEEKKYLVKDIKELFYLIDKAYNNNNNLINVDRTFNVEDSKKYEQTDFGKSLKRLLKSITSSCDKYIDKLFGNLKGTISDNMLHSSAYGCNGAYIYGNGVSEIKKLYKYLKEKDKEFKNINISDLPDFKEFKKELKQNLLSYLSQISNDNEKRDFITQIDIPEGNDTPTTPEPININALKSKANWEEYYEAANEQNRMFKIYKQNYIFEHDGENPWKHPRHGNGGGKQRGNSKITKISKKEILGKERCIYKISGDKKQYVKYKGGLITITEYKKIMAAKNTK